MKEKAYVGKDITVRYNLKRCIHVEACIKGAPKVFQKDARPWIQPDNGDTDVTAAVVVRCPAGALHYARADGVAEEVTPPDNICTVETDGPIYVHGDLRLKTAEGDVVKETRVALCRCGLSKNKPYCDNSHIDGGFKATGDVADNSADTKDADGGGELTMTAAKDGPVLLQGNFEIRSADGKHVFRASKGALCRCGASSNKPFCDGTHMVVSFESA